MVLCPACGRESPDGFEFCGFCRNPLDVVAPSSRHEERKVVTVLFCDLVGFTAKAEQLDPEDVRAVLGPYHSRLRVELERHGGTVEKFIGDAVMALFGAPAAHEDDPERAIRAALAIRDFAVEDGLELRIGITTGEALIALDVVKQAKQVAVITLAMHKADVTREELFTGARLVHLTAEDIRRELQTMKSER